MRKLPPELGIEIFYEWGSETYWDCALTEIMRARTGKFSIHAPYQGAITEMSLTDREDELFEYLRQPFRLYHKFGGEGYVVHINAPYAVSPSPEEKAERLKRVEDRLARLNDICEKEGVAMLVENLAFGHGQKTLCDQQDFLRLFQNNPALSCIVDTGHAVLGGIDIYAVQQALGGRLKAYHLHDNDGLEDLHRRVGTGVIDWKRFGEGARLYTPNAQFIMEYGASAVSEPGDYAEDADKIRAWLA
jgi:sugar phosphate isomerase/epimerase